MEKARLSGYIDRAVLKEAKIQAVREEISLSALVEKCLQLYLNQDNKKASNQEESLKEQERA